MRRGQVLVLYALVTESADKFSKGNQKISRGKGKSKHTKWIGKSIGARWTVRLLADYCASKGLLVSRDFVHKSLLLWGARGCVHFDEEARTWEAVHSGIREYLREGLDKDPDSGDLYKVIGEAVAPNFWEQFMGIKNG